MTRTARGGRDARASNHHDFAVLLQRLNEQANLPILFFARERRVWREIQLVSLALFGESHAPAFPGGRQGVVVWAVFGVLRWRRRGIEARRSDGRGRRRAQL